MNEHAPGWYDHDGERRYWDGQQWTHATSAPPPPPTPPGMPPTTPPSQGAVTPYGQPVGQPGAAPFAPGLMPPPRKEPALSLLASFFIPGLGSMINGDVGAGVAFLGAYIGSWVFMVCLGWLLIGFVGLPVAIGAWVWSMVHAYQGAVSHNRAVGYPG